MDPTDSEARRRREEVEKRLAGRYEELGHEDLAGGESWSLDEKQTALFLGVYSESGIRRVLEHYGLAELLACRGITAFEPEIDTSDPFLHVLRLKVPEGDTFFELRARTVLGRDVGLPAELGDLTLYAVEWLSVEQPGGVFSRSRPPLPGQRHPGLGMAAEIEEVLVLGARRVGAAGLVSRPQWFHNAFLYHPRWRFVDPSEEGRFAALVRDLQAWSLPRTSWAVHLGCVRDDEGEVLEWNPGPMLLPRTRAASRWFEKPLYRAKRLAAKATTRFTLDEEKLDRALAERGLDLP